MAYTLLSSRIQGDIENIFKVEYSIDAIKNSLFHYTGRDSFELILKNKNIRYGKVNNLNDKDEIDFGWNIIKEAYRVLFHKPFNELDFDSEISNPDVFVFSTSQCEDNLSMWGRYGDQCEGVSIELNGKKYFSDANSYFSKNSKFLAFYRLPVQYCELKHGKAFDIDEPIKKITSIFNHISQCYEKRKQANQQITDILRSYPSYKYLLSSMIKRKFWEEEKEVRFAVLLDSFNNDFIEHEFENSFNELVKGIYIGPKNKDINKREMEKLTNGIFEPTSIKLSKGNMR